MKNILKYLNEKEMEFYNQPKIDQRIPDNSDQVHNADDFMYSNSEQQSYYARGNGAEINDHQDFYEVIKVIKDLTDKHLFLRDMVWKVNTTGKKLIVNFSIGKDESEEANEFFFNGVQQYLMLSLWRQFGNFLKVDTEFLKNLDGRSVMQITIERNEGINRNEMKPLIGNPNVGLSPKSSSISRI